MTTGDRGIAIEDALCGIVYGIAITVWELDLNYRVVHCNQQARQI
jgi:hypothetical protein